MAHQGTGFFSAMKIWHAKEQLRSLLWYINDHIRHKNMARQGVGPP